MTTSGGALPLATEHDRCKGRLRPPQVAVMVDCATSGGALTLATKYRSTNTVPSYN